MSDYVVLLPVKALPRAKPRFRTLDDPARQRLLLALACDTADAALGAEGVAGVLAVTDDVTLARALAALGCAVIPDGSDDLNANLTQAAAEAVRRWPGAGVAVLCADLPAVRPAEITAALRGVPSGGAAYVVDHRGKGTTLYAAAPGAAFVPEFGFRSAELHAEAGAVAVAGELPGLRQDADDDADLDAVRLLGAGPRTAALLGG